MLDKKLKEIKIPCVYEVQENGGWVIESSHGLSDEDIAQIKQVFADEHEEAETRVIRRMGWPYKHAVAFPELRKELGMCLHEDYAFNGGKCSSCGKVFPGVWI
jgi:hypothetical protein